MVFVTSLHWTLSTCTLCDDTRFCCHLQVLNGFAPRQPSYAAGTSFLQVVSCGRMTTDCFLRYLAHSGLQQPVFERMCAGLVTDLAHIRGGVQPEKYEGMKAVKVSPGRRVS